MALLSGYEYDIFISYRHNDNRSGWVTEFVHALQEELAATIKEPLSIYFDKNPHDGLLETHSVDKSLEGKLKCLIFIPIISQTYCDPKSFAWQHEFCAFNSLAKQDSFGRDIKLANGNVASRILPIRIHDLDAEDKSMIEGELGGVLRAVDFIYKEAGVNRPLRAHEENPTRNQNQTVYRNQVNKVANAVKEIIGSLKNPVSPRIHPAKSQEPTAKSNASPKRTMALATVALMALLAAIYALSQFTGSSDKEPEALDKSIAVLPFADLSPDGDQEYLGDGISEEIINVLAQSPDLKVIARSSSFQFKGKNEDLRAIGKMLGVTTILEGSVRKYKDQVRVTAQLIRVSDGSHFWSKNFDQNMGNIFIIQDGIAAEVAAALKATLLGGKSSEPKVPWNEEAQRLYQQARYFYDRMDDAGAHELLKRSVAIDSNQAVSQLYLSFNYSNLGDSESSRIKLEKAFEIDPLLTEVRTAKALDLLQQIKFDEAYNEIKEALTNGANNPVTLRNAARIFQIIGRTDEASAFAKKAVELDPVQTRSWDYLVDNYILDGNYSEALKTIDQAPDTRGVLADEKAFCLMKLSRFDEAALLIQDQSLGNYSQALLNGLKGVKNDSMIRRLEIEFADKPEKWWIAYRLAELFANSGNTDKAMLYITNAVAEKHYNSTLAINPLYAPLHKDPRFIKLLEELNYPKLK